MTWSTPTLALLAAAVAVAPLSGCYVNHSPLHAGLDGLTFDDLVRERFVAGMSREETAAAIEDLDLETRGHPGQTELGDLDSIVAFIHPSGAQFAVAPASPPYSWDQLSFGFDGAGLLVAVTRIQVGDNESLHEIPLRRSSEAIP